MWITFWYELASGTLHTRISVCVCESVCVCACVCVCVHVCVHARARACACVSVRACVRLRVPAFVYMLTRMKSFARTCVGQTPQKSPHASTKEPFASAKDLDICEKGPHVDISEKVPMSPHQIAPFGKDLVGHIQEDEVVRCNPCLFHRLGLHSSSWEPVEKPSFARAIGLGEPVFNNIDNEFIRHESTLCHVVVCHFSEVGACRDLSSERVAC